MKTKIKTILTGMLMMVVCASASANTVNVSLVYTGDNDVDSDGVILAALGDALTFDLMVDSTDRPTLGGGFDVNFDADVFGFESYTYSGSGVVLFHRPPDIEDSRLFNGSYGVSFDQPVATIATIVFTITGVGTGSILPSGTAGFAGPWVDGVDFITLFDPKFSGATVRVVPVPAAAWFLFSGLGALLSMARRKAV